MIAIIDYGVGNLRSVQKAFAFIGQEAVITGEPAEIAKANAVVLPGVGAFADAMENLRTAGVEGAIRESIISKKPFLGICLGMQMLFDYSEEGNGRYEGLGIFRGCIKRLPEDKGLKIPHMGWNSLDIKKEDILFKGIDNGAFTYFVHSYYLEAADASIVSATSTYGVEFHASISMGNVFATQFHPEKSGEVGLSMLRNFASLLNNDSAAKSH